MKRSIQESLSTQMKRRTTTPIEKEPKYKGNFKTITSTGSTLLNLAISSNVIRGGGIPGGVLVIAEGPSQSGKTALLCEIDGNIVKNGGDDQFHDPEARLGKEFARIFGANIKKENYYQPDTVTELFTKVRKWEPKTKNGVVNGIFADSLAALSTNLEMENEEGDKMGGRRGKEFSEQLRKTCRIIKQKNYLMVCSNQLRVNMDGNKWTPKYYSPGGEALKFYASIRLRFGTPEKIMHSIKIAGKENKKVIGIKTEIEVIKTDDDPYRKASIYIIYGYGIDDIRANLQYIKDHTDNDIYQVGKIELDNSIEKSIQMVEKKDLIDELKEEVINLWETIESKHRTERKPKR